MTAIVDNVPVGATSEVIAPALNVPSRIILRTEAATERGKFENFLPADQRKLCEVGWEGRDLVFIERAKIGPSGEGIAEPIDAVKTAMEGLRKLPLVDLQTRAAELGVKWDKKASEETMLERIATKLIEAK